MAAEVYTPLSCEWVDTGGMPLWRFRMRKPGGGGHTHDIAAAAPHWRAAEYGIPADDVETILELLLHEIHADPATEPAIYEMTAVEALAAQTARIAHTREHRVTIDHTHAAWAPFYAGHEVTAERVAALAVHVDQSRRARRLAAAAVRFAAADEQQPWWAPPVGPTPPTHPRRTPPAPQAEQGRRRSILGRLYTAARTFKTGA